MAHWEPQKLSTKLCRLFDGGYATIQQFAKEAELPPHVIETACNKPGVRIDRDTEFRIRKVLSFYLRQNRALYRVMDRPPDSKRRVEEVELRTRDWREFEVYDSNGRCILYIGKPRSQVTQAFIDGLWRYLDREDPQPTLRVI